MRQHARRPKPRRAAWDKEFIDLIGGVVFFVFLFFFLPILFTSCV